MKFRLVSASVLETRTRAKRGSDVVRNERLVRAWVAAVLRRDYETARALCAPDMRMQATEPDGTSAEVVGFDETLAFSLRRIRAFGLSVRYEVVDSLSAGDRVALLFAPSHAEDGRPVAPQRMAVYTVKNGLIQSLRVYEGPTT